jgi:hypothetical protein
MFHSARRQMRSIAMLGVAAALVVGGVAAAQGDSQSGSEGNDQEAGKRPPGPPPMMGIAMQGLTYAELHVQSKDGSAETIRVDQGKVKSVGESSITLTENDDSEVTIAVDSDTEVMGKPGEETSLSDLEAGQQVSVSAIAGEAAKAIMVLPKKGDLVGAFHGGPMAPPPGAPDERRSGN